jgi:hypothetical protein
MMVVMSCLQMRVFRCDEHCRKAAGARSEMPMGGPACSAVTSPSDPSAVPADMKRTEALLRDARSVLRRA